MDTSVSRVNYIPASILLPVRPSVRPSCSPSRRQAKHCAEESEEASSSSSSSRSAKRRRLRGRLRVIGNRKAQPTRIQIIRPFISTATAGLAEPVVTRFRLIARPTVRIPLELLVARARGPILPFFLSIYMYVCIYVCMYV